MLDPEMDSRSLTAWLDEKLKQHPQSAALRQFRERVRPAGAPQPGLAMSAGTPQPGLAMSAGAPAAAMTVSGAVSVGRGRPGAANDGPFTDATVNRAIKNIFALDSDGDPGLARAGLRALWRLGLMSDASLAPSGPQFGYGGTWANFQSDSLINLNWRGAQAFTEGTFYATLARFDVALPEMEAQLHAIDPVMVDVQAVLFSALAGAYERTGRLTAEIGKLQQKLASGDAGTSELVLWLQLLTRLPPAQIRDLASLADEKLQASGIAASLPRVLLARLYAAAGRRDRAIGLYQDALIAQIPDSWIPIGRGSRFTALSLYADAQTSLDPPALDEMLAGMLRALPPGTDAGMQLAYSRFVMSVLEIDPRSAVAQREFESLVKAGSVLRSPADL